MSMQIKSVSPDLVSGKGKVVFSAEEGRSSVTVNNIEMEDMESASASELDKALRSQAKLLLQEALSAI